MNQGPRGYCLMKKIEGRKSSETVPLKDDILKLYKPTVYVVFLTVLLQCKTENASRIK
jgi:hypothetical protein